METYKLKLHLVSDATFGRGDGVAGLVDVEVEHDGDGLPFLRGRALKGLLAEESANILFALERAQRPCGDWHSAAQKLFGRPGSALDDGAGMHVSDARLPNDLQVAIRNDIAHKLYTSADVLDSLTTIRRQTAMDPTGKPESGSLRAMRVVVRETPFEAEVRFPAAPDALSLALLAACARALRRVGAGRNRGRGRVELTLWDGSGNNVTVTHFRHFQEEVRA